MYQNRHRLLGAGVVWAVLGLIASAENPTVCLGSLFRQSLFCRASVSQNVRVKSLGMQILEN